MVWNFTDEQADVSSNFAQNVKRAMEAVRSDSAKGSTETENAIKAAKESAVEYLAYHTFHDMDGPPQDLENGFELALSEANSVLDRNLARENFPCEVTTKARKWILNHVENYNKEMNNYREASDNNHKIHKDHLIENLNAATVLEPAARPFKKEEMNTNGGSISFRKIPTIHSTFEEKNVDELIDKVNKIKHVIESTIRNHEEIGADRMVGNVDVLKDPKTIKQRQDARVAQKATDSMRRLSLVGQMIQKGGFDQDPIVQREQWDTAMNDFEQYALSCVARGIAPTHEYSDTYEEFSVALNEYSPSAKLGPERNAIIDILNNPERFVSGKYVENGVFQQAAYESDLSENFANRINDKLSQISTNTAHPKIGKKQVFDLWEKKNAYLDQMSGIRGNPLEGVLPKGDIIVRNRNGYNTGIRHSNDPELLTKPEKLFHELNRLNGACADAYRDRLSDLVSKDLQNIQKRKVDELYGDTKSPDVPPAKHVPNPSIYDDRPDDRNKSPANRGR